MSHNRPSRQARRSCSITTIKYSGAAGSKKPTVVDGPFAETKELVAGFWLWECRSKEEAIEWARRIPNPDGDEGEVEIRQVFETADLAPSDPTGQIREQEGRLREELAKR